MTPAHALGSSHGETRIIRRSYLDRPRYATLLDRSYALWDELAASSGEDVLCRAGLVVLAAEGRSVPSGEALSQRADECGAAIEPLTGEEARRRFPWLHAPERCRGYYEADGGFVAVERSILAQCRLAEALGAELRFEEPALSWSATGGGVAVTTGKGTYTAGALIIAAGPWSSRLLSDLRIPLVVRRLAQLWFPAAPASGRGAARACFLVDLPEGLFFGFPFMGGEVKVAGGGLRDVVDDPTRLERRILPEDIAPVRRFVARCLPGVVPEPSRGSACMCTMTPDEDLVIDRHPEHSNVAFAAGLSGHGFKLAPAIGEILADLAASGACRLPIDFLRLRF
jgi:sarcosine oxidase